MNRVIFTSSKENKNAHFFYSFANADHKHVFWIIEKKMYQLFPFASSASYWGNISFMIIGHLGFFPCEIMYCIILYLYKFM